MTPSDAELVVICTELVSPDDNNVLPLSRMMSCATHSAKSLYAESLVVPGDCAFLLPSTASCRFAPVVETLSSEPLMPDFSF